MQVNIRIRDDLYKKLREEAKNWHRTITAQLEIILSEALEKSIETTETSLTSIKKRRSDISSNKGEDDVVW